MQNLTPDSYTIMEAYVDVTDGHRLYSQLWGAKRPSERFVYLHGGPGSGCGDDLKRLFDPTRHQVLFFDQRGAGGSSPYGSIDHNTTDELVDDITRVADLYDLGRFTLMGGSWGACLGLLFAVRKGCDRLERMIIFSVFTARRQEFDHLLLGQFRRTYPDLWRRYEETVPAEHRSNPTRYHVERILGGQPESAKESAYLYQSMARALGTLDDRFVAEAFSVYDPTEFDPAPTRIMCFYDSHGMFIKEGEAMGGASRIQVPVTLIQGRYDMICPPITAYELSLKLPNAKLFLTTAGHDRNDRATWDALRVAIGC